MVPPHLLSDDRSKDWHNLGPTGSVRSWPKDGVSPSPFKSGPVAPMCKLLPGGNQVVKIRTDIAHTYAINGYGKDDLASGIIFLAVHCCLWGGTNLDLQLDKAYMAFKEWCVYNRKTTSIQAFDKQTLKISSLLAWFWPYVRKFLDFCGVQLHMPFGRVHPG